MECSIADVILMAIDDILNSCACVVSDGRWWGLQRNKE